MRIDAPQSYFTQDYASIPSRTQAAGEPQKQPEKGIIVEISPEAKEAAKKLAEGKRCETCANRKYQDVSNDPSVSFQTPTKINPSAAASAVAAHESEHVANEKAKAEREDRKIINQTVTLKTGICPECHRMYVSGGVTRTTSVADNSEPPSVSQPDVPEQANPQGTPS
jgi:hypothetical protein